MCVYIHICDSIFNKIDKQQTSIKQYNFHVSINMKSVCRCIQCGNTAVRWDNKESLLPSLEVQICGITRFAPSTI